MSKNRIFAGAEKIIYFSVSHIRHAQMRELHGGVNGWPSRINRLF